MTLEARAGSQPRALLLGRSRRVIGSKRCIVLENHSTDHEAFFTNANARIAGGGKQSDGIRAVVAERTAVGAHGTCSRPARAGRRRQVADYRTTALNTSVADVGSGVIGGRGYQLAALIHGLIAKRTPQHVLFALAPAASHTPISPQTGARGDIPGERFFLTTTDTEKTFRTPGSSRVSVSVSSPAFEITEVAEGTEKVSAGATISNISGTDKKNEGP